MISQLCRLFSTDHRECKTELHALMQSGLDGNKKIQSLNSQIISLTNQIQELRAINDYQAFEFERRIIKLQDELASEKPKGKREQKIT